MRYFVRAKMCVMWVGITCVSWLGSMPAMADAGDINGDGEVDQFDREIMALHWIRNQPLELPG